MFSIGTHWTPKRMLEEVFADKGRKIGQTSGSHVHDLASLDKVISLCSCCVGKFQPNQFDYVTNPKLPLARGACDGCREFGAENRLFFKRGTFH